MRKTITFDDRRFKAVAAKARTLVKTPKRYLDALIDAATTSLDDILAPVRKEFLESRVTEDELDAVINRARKSVFTKRPRKPSR